jgi:hypothetical protein
MTGETPCGHYVRAWAVLAPAGPLPGGPGTAVTASGQFITTDATNITRTLTATTGTNFTGISNTGHLLSGRADGGGGGGGGAGTAAINTMAAGFGHSGMPDGPLPWHLTGAGAGPGGAVSGFALDRRRRRQSLAGAGSLDAMRRRRVGEISHISDANLSGAMLMSGLFSGPGAGAGAGDGGFTLGSGGVCGGGDADGGFGLARAGSGGGRLGRASRGWPSTGAHAIVNRWGGGRGAFALSRAVDGHTLGRAGCRQAGRQLQSLRHAAWHQCDGARRSPRASL